MFLIIYLCSAIPCNVTIACCNIMTSKLNLKLVNEKLKWHKVIT